MFDDHFSKGSMHTGLALLLSALALSSSIQAAQAQPATAPSAPSPSAAPAPSAPAPNPTPAPRAEPPSPTPAPSPTPGPSAEPPSPTPAPSTEPSAQPSPAPVETSQPPAIAPAPTNSAEASSNPPQAVESDSHAAAEQAPNAAVIPLATPSQPAVALPVVAPEAPEAVEVVVVGSSASRVPGSTQVISKRQLQRFHYDDPQALLLQAPGVYVRQEDGVGLRPNIGIRGANADRSKKVTLMEDGVLFGPAPYSAPAAYYFPLMARMTQVRVVKGPSAIGYGPQTVGGAIDFITRPIPSEVTGALDIAGGEYGYAKAHGYFGTSTERMGFLVEGVHLQNSGFKELPSGADTGSARNDWMVKASFEPDTGLDYRNRFLLKLSYADEVSNETYLGLSDADFEQNPYARYPASNLDQMKNHRAAIVLSHQFDLEASGINIKTDAYRHEYARIWRKVNRLRGAAIPGVLEDPEDPTNAEYYAVLSGAADGATAADTIMVGPNDRKFVSQGIQSLFRMKPQTGPLAHSIEAGLRVHNDSIDRRHSETGFVMSAGQLVPEGSPESVTTAETAETNALALHALDALGWNELTLTPGARIEMIWSSLDDRLNGEQADGFTWALMPGVGAYWSILPELGLLGGVYRGFSPPPPASDDAISAEFSVNYELGARYASKQARAEVIGFFNDYSNLTDVCTLSSGCLSDNLDRQFDAGKARIYGVEVYAADETELGFGELRLPYTAIYTFTRSRFGNDFASQDPIFGAVQVGDELPYVPRHQARASVGVENERAGFVASVTYASQAREAAGSEPLDEVLATDEQLWIDVGARTRLTRSIEVYADARNLTDSVAIVSRRPYGARPNPPRWVQVGARLSF